MSEIVSEDEGFDPKFFFPNFRGPSLDISESSTELAESEATVVGFGKNEDILFTPIIGGHLNFTSQQEDEDYPSHPNDTDVNGDINDTSDIYLTLVIVSVSLIVLVLLSYALYKAVLMLKISLNDGRHDSLTVPGSRRPHSTSATTNTTGVTTLPVTSSVSTSRSPVTSHHAVESSSTNVSHLASPVILSTATMPHHSPPRRHTSFVTQAQNTFIQGIRNFHPPMFTSTLTRRHEEDLPPPYDEPSPPPYHIAIQMRPNFDDGFKLDPIKIGRRTGDFDSISLDSGDVTDGIKKYVSVAIVV